MKTIDITEFTELANKADIILEILNEYGAYIELGREKEFINNTFKNIDELLKRRMIKELKKNNLIVHHKYGLI